MFVTANLLFLAGFTLASTIGSRDDCRGVVANSLGGLWNELTSNEIPCGTQPDQLACALNGGSELTLDSYCTAPLSYGSSGPVGGDCRTSTCHSQATANQMWGNPGGATACGEKDGAALTGRTQNLVALPGAIFDAISSPCGKSVTMTGPGGLTITAVVWDRKPSSDLSLDLSYHGFDAFIGHNCCYLGGAVWLDWKVVM